MKNRLLLIVAATGILIFGCKNRGNDQSPQVDTASSPSPKMAKPDTYIGLRNLVWNSNPDSFGLKIHPDSVYCVILDMGLGDEAVATLVVIADGTTSIYLSSGGGILGAGQHEQVRAASFNLLKMIPHPSKRFARTENFLNIPGDSRARFYLLTRNGKYASKEFNADDAAGGNGYYSNLFIQANHVITAARASTPN